MAPFAEGLFDSLGVVIEDGKGLKVVAGQKAELTRISDTNGDGIADKYETLFDAHSYHGNYHSYMHGPVRGKDGSYYFALNLVHDGTGSAYTAGGNVMGTWGGFNGWAIRVMPDGKSSSSATACAVRPASAWVPDGRIWYADNQGDFVGTSKLFALRKDAFYGHPAGLVDLPGMTPDSPQIAWDKVADRKEREIIMFPHNRVANSPGNPAWVTGDKFGPFKGQMFIGDQTQSNLLRVVVESIDGVEQGSVMPFFEGLESGVMRPVFMPDGSLLLGQTGRGWQAKGGKVASLQHVRWDGKTVAPAILAMSATRDGFRVSLTQPLGGGVTASLLRSALATNPGRIATHPTTARPSSICATRRPRRSRSVPDARLCSSLWRPPTSPRCTRSRPRDLSPQARLADPVRCRAPAQLEAYYTLSVFPPRIDRRSPRPAGGRAGPPADVSVTIGNRCHFGQFHAKSCKTHHRGQIPAHGGPQRPSINGGSRWVISILASCARAQRGRPVRCSACWRQSQVLPMTRSPRQARRPKLSTKWSSPVFAPACAARSSSNATRHKSSIRSRPRTSATFPTRT